MNNFAYSKGGPKTSADIQVQIDQALYDRAYLRHLCLLNGDVTNNDIHGYSEEEEQHLTTEGIQEEIKKISLERDFLLKEILSLTEENDDLYSTLDRLIEEKENIRIQTNKATEELETCKQLIDFLVLERDEMKKEIDTKDKLLDCYNHLYNKENMFHFREVKKKECSVCYDKGDCRMGFISCGNQS